MSSTILNLILQGQEVVDVHRSVIGCGEAEGNQREGSGVSPGYGTGGQRSHGHGACPAGAFAVHGKHRGGGAAFGNGYGGGHGFGWGFADGTASPKWKSSVTSS